MGNILGEVFDDYVKGQIESRQKIYGSRERSIEQLKLLNNQNAYLRLASSIDLNTNAEYFDEKNKKVMPDLVVRNAAQNILSRLGDKNAKYAGQNLAKYCVLLNGINPHNTLVIRNEKDEITHSSVIPSSDVMEGINYPKSNQEEQSFTSLYKGAWGFGGTDLGYRPMPGLTGADIIFYNQGSLRKATIQIVAYNLQQLELIDLLYMKVGYSILLVLSLTVPGSVNVNTSLSSSELLKPKVLGILSNSTIVLGVGTLFTIAKKNPLLSNI